jgi:hypothetical protein
VQPQRASDSADLQRPTTTMATQFIVRSEGNKHALSLKTVVYDGLDIRRLQENGIPIFELPSDEDMIIELVVKRKNSSASETNPKPASNSSKKRKATDFKTPDDILRKRYSAEEITVSYISWLYRLL